MVGVEISIVDGDSTLDVHVDVAYQLGLQGKVYRAMSSFVLHTHRLYILRHCSVVILHLFCRRITLIHRLLYLTLNKKIMQLTIIYPFCVRFK